jgi:hypothetical protein
MISNNLAIPSAMLILATTACVKDSTHDSIRAGQTVTDSNVSSQPSFEAGVGAEQSGIDASGVSALAVAADASFPPLCRTDSDCATVSSEGNSLRYCESERCELCVILTNDGCGTDAPYCVRRPEGNRCVECTNDDSCRAGIEAARGVARLCIDYQCVAGCQPQTQRGCDGDAWCLETETGRRCIECQTDGHCATAGTGNTCLDERCQPCSPITHTGCEIDSPYCVDLNHPRRRPISVGDDAGVSPTDGGADIEVALRCVECLSESDCGASLPACADGTCVECDRDEQCEDKSASQCDVRTHTCAPCNSLGQCQHLPDTPACDTEHGECVECTRHEDTRCIDNELYGTSRTCVTLPEHPDYLTCSWNEKGAYSYGECVSDSQCVETRRCVAETFKSSGAAEAEMATGLYYCMPLEGMLPDGETCADHRPFHGFYEATSEGGVRGVYCRPRYTTWSGFEAFEDHECTSDDDCGVPGFDDGYCVERTASTRACTYACGGNSDCPNSCALQSSLEEAPSSTKLCAFR